MTPQEEQAGRDLIPFGIGGSVNVPEDATALWLRQQAAMNAHAGPPGSRDARRGQARACSTRCSRDMGSRPQGTF